MPLCFETAVYGVWCVTVIVHAVQWITARAAAAAAGDDGDDDDDAQRLHSWLFVGTAMLQLEDYFSPRYRRFGVGTMPVNANGADWRAYIYTPKSDARSHLNYRPDYVASLCAGLTLMMYIGPVVVGNVSDNSISSYRLHASETQQLSYVLMFVADATAIFCRLYAVARMQPSANDGPTCSTPWQHNGSEIDSLHGKTFWDRCNYLLHRCIVLSAAIGVLNVGNHRHS